MAEKNFMNGLHQDPLVTQMMSQMNRIEGKVDTMQTAIVAMARTEERVITLLASDQKKTDWLLKLQDRVNEIEKNDVGQKAISTRLERAAWIIITTLLTGFVGWLIAAGSV